MNVLRIFLMGVAGAFASVAVGGVWLITDGHYIIGAGLTAAAGALAFAIFKQAQRYTIESTETQNAQFEETVREMAGRTGGLVALPVVVKTTGFSRDRAEQKLRELVGRGIFELNFGDNGELRFKLTPLDEARAQLMSMQDKRLPP